MKTGNMESYLRDQTMKNPSCFRKLNLLVYFLIFTHLLSILSLADLFSPKPYSQLNP